MWPFNLRLEYIQACVLSRALYGAPLLFEWFCENVYPPALDISLIQGNGVQTRVLSVLHRLFTRVLRFIFNTTKVDNSHVAITGLAAPMRRIEELAVRFNLHLHEAALVDNPVAFLPPDCLPWRAMPEWIDYLTTHATVSECSLKKWLRLNRRASILDPPTNLGKPPLFSIVHRQPAIIHCAARMLRGAVTASGMVKCFQWTSKVHTGMLPQFLPVTVLAVQWMRRRHLPGLRMDCLRCGAPGHMYSHFHECRIAALLNILPEGA